MSRWSLPGLALWIVAIGSMWRGAADYAFTPAIVAAAPDRWPVQTTLPLDRRRPTLVMALHPHCPCSRASVSELSRLVAAQRDLLCVQVLFMQPADQSHDWAQSDLWQAVRQIPGVQVRQDWNLEQAGRFGLTVSGECLLFAPDGRRLFRGGITPGRGHCGDGVGRDAIDALLAAPHGSALESRVFGCRLKPIELKSDVPNNP